jgi:hypothetical protein
MEPTCSSAVLTTFNRLSIYLSLYLSIYLSIYVIYLSIYGSTALCFIFAAFSVSRSFTQSIGLLGWGINPSQGRYLHTGQHKHRIILQLPTPKTLFNSILDSYSIRLSSRNSTLHSRPLFYSTLQPLCTDYEESTGSIVKEACLQLRCLPTDVLLLLFEFACAGMCLASRCLAMDIHVTLDMHP